MTNITIPYNYTPRNYQKNLYNAISNGYKRGVSVFHRRAGKDKTLINMVVKEMHKRVGVYYYILPTYTQGKKIIWDGIDKSGFKFIDHFPPEIVKRKNESEMLIELVNGSIFQIIGSDNYDRIVGTNPVGVVFSEYSLQNPLAWDYIRPIIAENNGWAFFCYTPRGENHGFELYEMALNNPEWFCELLTAKDTKLDDGTPVISESIIQQERKAGMSEEMIEQEFYCSFTAANVGAYYARQLKDYEHQMTSVPFNLSLPVDTYWDLGMADSTAIIFVQTIGDEHHIIDCYENSGESLEFYAKYLEEKPYTYRHHYAPHDIEVRELGTGKSRLEVARKLGISFRIVPNIGVQDGIEAGRFMFKHYWFDSNNSRPLIRALRNYHKEFDDKNQVYKQRPVHDWSSHFADAFRYMSVALKPNKSVDHSGYKTEEIVL